MLIFLLSSLSLFSDTLRNLSCPPNWILPHLFQSLTNKVLAHWWKWWLSKVVEIYISRGNPPHKMSSLNPLWYLYCGVGECFHGFTSSLWCLKEIVWSEILINFPHSYYFHFLTMWKLSPFDVSSCRNLVFKFTNFAQKAPFVRTHQFGERCSAGKGNTSKLKLALPFLQQIPPTCTCIGDCLLYVKL